MPAGLTVPTIFTAVDKMSATIGKMGKSLGGFTKTAAFGISRLNEKFNNFFKLGDLQKQFLSLASTAAVAAAIISGIQFSARSLLDYDKAIAQLHNTLYAVSGGNFSKFQQAVEQTAKSTDSSTIDIANSFKTIAQLNQTLAKTPESLSAVSKAALTLSRATGADLTPATEGLVGILNIFRLQAKDSSRVINVLAAAQANGAGTLDEQIEGYRAFGVIAKSANLTLEQTAGLQSVFGQMMQKGSMSATTLRTAIIRLQKAGAGYQSGQFNLNDALAQTIHFYDKIKNQRGKDDFLIKLFGPRGASAGRILLDNAQKINEVTKSVTGTNDAFEMASRNMNTVYGLLDRIKNKWVTFITTNTAAGEGLTRLKNILNYVITNFDTIIDKAITFVKWFAIIKVGIFALNTGLALYNGLSKIMAISTALMGNASQVASGQLALGSTQLSLFTGEAVAAESAAATLFATLGSFVLPAALVALGGGLLYKFAKGVSDERAYNNKMAADAKKNRFYSSTNIGAPFSNTSEESNYQRWWLDQVKSHPKLPESYAGFGRNVFDKKFGSIFDTSIFDPNAMKNPAFLAPSTQAVFNHEQTTTQNKLSIDIHDPGGNVKTINTKGPMGIPVKISSTTGKQ